MIKTLIKLGVFGFVLLLALCTLPFLLALGAVALVILCIVLTGEISVVIVAAALAFVILAAVVQIITPLAWPLLMLGALYLIFRPKINTTR